MGQFYVLKYFADDLRREINHPISEQQETAWQKNLALERGKFIAEEADDFYHTIQIGELPYGTCLSYRTGSSISIPWAAQQRPLAKKNMWKVHFW